MPSNFLIVARSASKVIEGKWNTAGFEWDAESDLLSNPDDDRTWNIFDDDAARRDQTDRFLFRFRKPARS